MAEITTVGLDLAKNVFQAHGADASGRAVLRKKLRRDQVLAFFAQLPRCVVAMEACGGAHFWGRELARLGHEVRLIPPSYVKPFVKRQKERCRRRGGHLRGGPAAHDALRAVKSEEVQGAAWCFACASF
jgi:transposase